MLVSHAHQLSHPKQQVCMLSKSVNCSLSLAGKRLFFSSAISALLLSSLLLCPALCFVLCSSIHSPCCHSCTVFLLILFKLTPPTPLTLTLSLTLSIPLIHTFSLSPTLQATLSHTLLQSCAWAKI